MSSEFFYATAPKDIPADYTAPTKSFKHRVILALIGLLAFVVIYFILMIWFGRSAYRLFTLMSNGATDNGLLTLVTGVCLAFL